jgi:hypothetical protein
LQSKSIAVKVVELCSSMDLVATITRDNAIAVYRTFTW